MIYSILFVILASISYWLYTRKIVPAEVKLNADAIAANGAADDLRKGFHQRRSWARMWPALACCLVPSLSFSLSNWISFLTSFLAMAALLGGFFARYFTPWLNVAMELDYKPEWYCSPDSASWPDAAIWKKLRRANPGIPDSLLLAEARTKLKALLESVWLWCRLAAGALAVAAVVVAAGR
jgi:hypothetical protein